MNSDNRGDLRSRSVSLPDIKAAYHRMTEKTADFAYDQIFDKGPDLLGEGLPDDLKSNVGQYVKALASVSMPDTVQKIDSWMKSTSSSLAMLGKDASKIMMAAEAVGTDHDNPNFRLISPKLTFEEARRYYKWQGTILEFRLGTILSGPADPQSHFSIYVDGGKPAARSNLKVTVTNKSYQ